MYAVASYLSELDCVVHVVPAVMNGAVVADVVGVADAAGAADAVGVADESLDHLYPTGPDHCCAHSYHALLVGHSPFPSEIDSAGHGCESSARDCAVAVVGLGHLLALPTG